MTSFCPQPIECEKPRCSLFRSGGASIIYAQQLYLFLFFVTVIAIDIDPKKIQLAKHNATIYKVADRIEFIIGDFFKIAPSLKADVVFLSPPWGGPNYLDQEMISLQNIMEPQGGRCLFQTAKLISEHIAFYLPRNTNVDEVGAQNLFIISIFDRR